MLIGGFEVGFGEVGDRASIGEQQPSTFVVSALNFPAWARFDEPACPEPTYGYGPALPGFERACGAPFTTGLCLKVRLNMGGAIATGDPLTSYRKVIDFQGLAPAWKRYAFHSLFVDASRAIRPLRLYNYTEGGASPMLLVNPGTQGYYRVRFYSPQVVLFQLDPSDPQNDPVEILDVYLYSGVVSGRVWRTQ